MSEELKTQIENAIKYNKKDALKQLLSQFNNTDPKALDNVITELGNKIIQSTKDVETKPLLDILELLSTNGINIDFDDETKKIVDNHFENRDINYKIDDLNLKAQQIRKNNIIGQNSLTSTVNNFIDYSLKQAIKEIKTTISKQDERNLVEEFTKALVNKINNNNLFSERMFDKNNKGFVNTFCDIIISQDIVKKDNSWSQFIKNVLKIFIGQIEPILKGTSKIYKLENSENVAKNFTEALISLQENTKPSRSKL